MSRRMDARERLVKHVQELERLQAAKDEAAAAVSEAFAAAKANGYDPGTLRVVLKLRKMTPNERQERRALEAIYMAALGMLEGDALPEAARRRLDGPGDRQRPLPSPDQKADEPKPKDGDQSARQPEQPPLIVKDPAEAKAEGAAAAAAGKRIYDNPYPAGDPCRAAWDEGWCGQKQSHGMETPAAFQRRSDKPPKPPKEGGDGSGEQGKDAGAGDDVKKGAA